MLPATPSLKKTLALAQKEAESLKHKFIGREHALLAMLSLNDGVVGKIFNTVGLTHEMASSIIVNHYDPASSLEGRISALEAQVKELQTVKEGK